jgi:deoxyribonuclease V
VKAHDLHAWDLSPTEAVALQKRLRDRVVLQPLPDDVRVVAGADISYERYSNVLHAGFVLVRLPDFEVVETAGVELRVSFPYVPGLLSFRETPPLVEAWKRVTVRPDVVMLDGQGLAHPRRFGIACHVGLLFDLPTLGCAKTLLVGKFEPPGEAAGSRSPLVDRGETVGSAVRTKDRVQPVYVSPGHLADVESAAALALRCTARYRVPEPTRLAHLFVNALRRGEEWTPPRR